MAAFIYCSGDKIGHNYKELRRVMYRYERYKELPDGALILHYKCVEDAKLDMKEAYKVFSEHPDRYSYNYWRSDYFTFNDNDNNLKECETSVFLYHFKYFKKHEQTGSN